MAEVQKLIVEPDVKGTSAAAKKAISEVLDWMQSLENILTPQL